MSWQDILKNEVSGKWWPILQKYLVDDFTETHLVVVNHMWDTGEKLQGQSFEGDKMPIVRFHSLLILAGTEKLEEVMRNHSGFMDELEEAGINIAVIRWEPVVRQWFSSEISATMKQFTDMDK
tara:strand:- start:172 stop:540 length:369 start_codon:yes stop_codon:yes gene_type:complete